MNESTTLIKANSPSEPFTHKPVGAFARLIAYIIDWLVISIIGLLFFPFGSLVEQLGKYDWVPLFAVGMVYFALFDSAVLGRSSIGKKIMKIRLIGKNGKAISPLRAVLRAILISFPFFNQQIGQLFPPDTSEVVGNLYVLLVVVVFVGITLFLISNPQKQGLQDLLTKTFVAPAKSVSEQSVSSKIGPRPVIVSLIGILIFGAVMMVLFKKLPEANDIKALNERVRRQALNENLSAGYREFYMNGKRSWYAVEIKAPISYEDFKDEGRMQDISAALFSAAKKSNNKPEVDSVRLALSSKKYYGLLSVGYGRTEQKKMAEIE